MATKRLSEARRCFAVLALALLLLTLFGSHLPWMLISEEGHTHTWYITETHDNETNSDNATYYMDMYFNLMSVESCMTFQEDSDFFFDGQELCSVMSFDDAVDKYTIDVHDWDMYMDSCESAGITAFALVAGAVVLLIVVVLCSTVKNVQRKCCPEAYERQHGKAKCVVPFCAAFAPICAGCAVVIYYIQCIEDAQGQDVVTADDVTDVHRSATGYQGFWIALSGSVCLLFWWILFTIWFCNKTVARQEFAGSGPTRGNDAAQQPINQESDDDISYNM